MPLPPPDENKKQRGREKKTKERNLLERLRDYQTDVLRFMRDAEVPFTNNCGENDLRITKVQQKISGCFRSLEGAKIFCRERFEAVFFSVKKLQAFLPKSCEEIYGVR